MNIKKELSQSYRFGIALILLTAVSLYGNLDTLFSKTRDYPDPAWQDPVSIHERRMEPLKAMLPPAGSVGYVTTVENEKFFSLEKGLQDVELLAQFIVTQYTLAPVFVYNSPDYPLVVGNFLSGPPDPVFLRRNRLVPGKDFGDGVILFERRG
jgi:hypothetical protein